MSDEAASSPIPPLSAEERQALSARLRQYRRIAARYFEMWTLVEEIFNLGLDREHGNRELFCRNELNCSEEMALKNIKALRPYRILSGAGVVLSCEGQARWLTRLDDNELAKAAALLKPIQARKKITWVDCRLVAEEVSPTTQNHSVKKLAPAQFRKLGGEALAEAQALRETAGKEMRAELLDRVDRIIGLLSLIAVGSATREKPNTTGDETASAKETSSVAEEAPPSAATSEIVTGSGHQEVPQVNEGNMSILRSSPCNPKIQGAAKPHSIRAKPGPRPISVTIARSTLKIRQWNEVLLTVANWILHKRHAVPALKFVQLDPAAFSSSARIAALKKKRAYIEYGDDRAGLVRKSRRLLNASGFEGLSVSVRLITGETIKI